MESTLISSLNLLALLGFLGYKLRGPVREFVRQRHETIENDLTDVAIQYANAKEKFEETSAKLSAVETEMVVIREQLKQDIEHAQKNILADANRVSTTIVTDAKAVSETLYSQLKKELHQEFALKVIHKTESLLKERLTGDDQLRIRNEFSQEVETLQ